MSLLFYRDQLHWFTKKRLVFDIFVEPYCVHRVFRQLSVHQEFPLPRETLDRTSHMLTRKGQDVAYEATWATKI